MTTTHYQQEGLPSFEDLFDREDFQEPAVRSLVTHKWSKEKNIYRTGVVLPKGKGKKVKQVRFFYGHHNGKRCYTDLVFDYTPERFRNHLCLARLDLVVGSLCYDWDAGRWCMLTKIDCKTGGVFVAYEKDNKYENETLISPDQLVGVLDDGAANSGELIFEDSSDQDVLHYDGDDDEDGDDCNDNDEEDNGCDTVPQSQQLTQSVPRNGSSSFLDHSDVELEEHFESDAHSKSAAGTDQRAAAAGVDCESSDDSLQYDIYSNNTSHSHDSFDVAGGASDSAPDVAGKDLVENETSTPKFDIRIDDPYVTPEVGELVTYLFHAPDQYRVGVKCTKGNLLTFFEGETLVPDHYSYSFHINKKGFRDGHWRARPELSIGSRCYESQRKEYGTLRKIDVKNGSVTFFCEGTNMEVVIAPDHLITAPGPSEITETVANNSMVETAPVEADENEPDRVSSFFTYTNDNIFECQHFGSGTMVDPIVLEKPAPTKTTQLGVHSLTETAISKNLTISMAAPNASQDAHEHHSASTSEPQLKRQKLDKRCYNGVFSGKDASGNTTWYIRGKLRKSCSGSRPILLLGEKIEYKKNGGINIEYWESDVRQNQENVVLMKKCKAAAERGEKEYAERYELERKMMKARLTSFPLRRGQPVVVVGALLRNAIVVEELCLGSAKVRFNDGTISTERMAKLRPIGFQGEKVDLDAFFRKSDPIGLPVKDSNYSEEPDFLLKAWRDANKKVAHAFEEKFESSVKERNQKRRLANQVGDGSTLTKGGAWRLRTYCDKLLGRLQEDFAAEDYETQLEGVDLKRRIADIKIRLPNPNMLLLCGGFAPEITAYKRLGAAPIGKVILQDTDLLAVGVAVACHPDVAFYIVISNPKSKVPKDPGDARILTDPQVVREIEVRIGGIHDVKVTNPCTHFSLAGLKDGFNSESGQLLFDCCTVTRNVEASSGMPTYIFENVPSTNEVNEQSHRYLPDVGASYFNLCASSVSPCIRRRKFATNRPPVICSTGPNKPGNPPSLDGNHSSLCASSVVDEENRMVHPDMKKFPCQLSSNANKNNCVWLQRSSYFDPVRVPPTPKEAELAMGYRNDELGVTAFTAKTAIENRIKSHNYEKDGCLVSLQGCASDPDYPLEKLSDTKRLSLLGNSECVTLLEALMWGDKRLFPPIL